MHASRRFRQRQRVSAEEPREAQAARHWVIAEPLLLYRNGNTP
jgi:hypothetical protein